MKPSPCLHPKYIRCKDGVFRSVPCGKCEACLVNKGFNRMNRIKDYIQDYPYKFFVTLTFADKFLPLARYSDEDYALYHDFDCDYNGVVNSCSLSNCNEKDIKLICNMISKYGGVPVLSHRVLILFKKRFRENIKKLNLNNYSDVSANMASVANAVKSLSEAKGQTISNSFAEQMAMKDLALKQAEIDIALEKTKVGTETWKKLKEEKRVVELNADMLFETFNARKENFDLQNDVLRANKSMMEESGKQMAADAAYKDSLTALNNIRAQFEPQALRSTIAQLMSYVTLNGSLANLNDKQADKVVLEKFNEMAKNVGLKLDNTQKYTIMPYITKQAKEAARGAKIENDWKPLRYGAEVIEKGAKAFVTKMLSAQLG